MITVSPRPSDVFEVETRKTGQGEARPRVTSTLGGRAPGKVLLRRVALTRTRKREERVPERLSARDLVTSATDKTHYSTNIALSPRDWTCSIRVHVVRRS